MFSKRLKEKRCGTGGLLFLFSSLFLAVTMVTMVTLMKAATTRSVGESVEHTIALECLASCYVNPTANNCTGAVTNYKDNAQFAPITTSGTSIEPLNEFNRIMINYHLMNPGQAATEMTMTYKKSDTHEGSTVGTPTFEIQAGGFGCFNELWTKNITIICNPVKCTIEKSYTG